MRLFCVAFALGSLTGANGLGAESPQRFLQATQWIAQVTRSVSDSGTAVVDKTQLDWDLTTQVQVQFRMPKKFSGIGAGVPVWEAVETQQYLGSGHEHLSQIDLETGGSVIADGQPATRKPPPNFLLSMDLEAGKYTLSFGALDVPWDGTIVYSGAFSIPQPDVPFWSGADSGNVERPLPESGMVLSGQATYGLKEPPIVHTSVGVTTVYTLGLGGGQIRINWTIQPAIEQLELAVDIEGYQDWLPEGNFKDAKKSGKTMNIIAKVQGTNGAPTTAKASWIRFELLDVSKEPGVCLNQPLKASAKTDPDYGFETEKNPLPMFRWSNEKVETLPGGQYASAKAVLSSFDFGGWCRLKVTAEVQGQILTGFLTSDRDKIWPEIRIPRRQEESHIADAWLEKEGAVGMEDGVDDENTPVGDGDKGDGYTVYEEYRGFAQNGSILRTKPKAKDLMILNTVGGPGAAGSRLFKKISQLEVHHTFRASEFSSDSNTKDNWLNFNHGSHHVTDQHGLRLVLDQNKDSAAAAANNLGNGDGNSTPGSKRDITVPPKFNVAAIRTGNAQLTKYLAASYAHEMGHGCAMYHHGDTDPRVVIWTVQDGAAGQDWFENSGLILPKGEDGVPLLARKVLGTNGIPAYPTFKVYLAGQRGEHSGDTKCAMRYDAAEAYIFPAGTNSRYVTGGGEEVGTTLCTRAAGTGVNDPSHTPQPRFGNAAAGRGNCMHQLCVNDKYVIEIKHIR